MAANIAVANTVLVSSFTVVSWFGKHAALSWLPLC